MYPGKTLFAQIVEFLPWTTSIASSIATGGSPDAQLQCAEQFRAMAFAN